MSKFVQKVVRYRYEPVADPLSSASHIQGEAVAVGQTYHLESDAQFKRDLEQSLSEIVKKRLQEAEDEAIGLVQVAERTAESNAKQIADDILSKANAQAKEMVETAQAQVDSIQEAAHEEGFKMGFQEGYADATTQVEQEVVGLLQSAHLVTDNAYRAEKLILKNYEKNALALIEHLARKILQRELKDDSETLLNMVHHAVESLYLTGKIKMVLNPQVLQELRAFSGATESAMTRMSRFEFVVDPLLELTQVFIVSEEGAFDLSMEKQVAQLMAPLAAAVSLPRPETMDTHTDPSAENIDSPTDLQSANALNLSLLEPEAASETILEDAPALTVEAGLLADSLEGPLVFPPELLLAEAFEAAEPSDPKAALPEALGELDDVLSLSAPLPEPESPSGVKPYHFQDLDPEQDLL
ncbi:FliH/SctL family protein [Vampirovibrio sp.]|uniref:FliH/SctL family protein n=1 Tax=Vampirovibrio sp. TaxID=2717857 RepID=UPI003593CA6D